MMSDLKSRLGRIPSPPDERDYKLENFLGVAAIDADPDIPAAYAELKLATVTYKRWAATTYKDVTQTHWWKALNDLGVLAPAPDPPPPLPPSPTPVENTVWANNEPVLDQGDYGTCVGNGFAQWGNTLPIDDRFVEKDARAIYYEATILDGSPDDPDAHGGGQQGSTVRSGAQAMVNRTRARTYAFTTQEDTIVSFLESSGPLVVGSDFTWDMENPDENGYVTPTGGVAGGHCYLLAGNLIDEGAFLFLNSWGAGWGQKGYFKMKYDDFMTLLEDQGEVCAIVEVA